MLCVSARLGVCWGGGGGGVVGDWRRYGLGLKASTDGELEGAAFFVTQVDNLSRTIPRPKLQVEFVAPEDSDDEDALGVAKDTLGDGGGEEEGEQLVPEDEGPDYVVGDEWMIPDEGTLTMVVEYAPTRPKVRLHTATNVNNVDDATTRALLHGWLLIRLREVLLVCARTPTVPTLATCCIC